MPIIGIVASSITNSTLADIGAIVPLQVVTVGSPSSSITLSNIPNTYTHLQLRCLTRGTASSQFIEVRMRFNGDTATNYASHQIYSTGSGAVSDGEANADNIYISYSPANTATASVFSGASVDILDYANTNKYKTTRTLSGNDQNGSGYVLFRSGHWRSNSAISSITIYPASGNLAQYSQIALYGVKSA